MRYCRQTKVGELEWGLALGLETKVLGWGVHDLYLAFIQCMHWAKFFKGTVCKNSPHCQGSNLRTTNVPTENIIVSPHTLKKLLCK